MRRTHTADAKIRGADLVKGIFPGKPPRRIAIVGSRNYPEPNLVAQLVKALPRDSLIISGGAKGPDTFAEVAARAEGISRLIYEPRWETHGKAAGHIRNELIVRAADHVIAFWDQRSTGTLSTITKALEAAKPVTVINGAGLTIPAPGAHAQPRQTEIA